jgi:putative transcriptional regulator
MMMSRLETLVADEAIGALDPARSLFVASLASMNPGVSREIARYEAAGGALLAGVAPVTLKAGGFERLLAGIERLPAGAEPILADPGLAGLPEPLRGPVAEALRRGAWTRLLRGVEGLDLGPGVSGAGVAQLLRVQPGAGIPRHSHGGEELTLVLSGGFTDEVGHFGPGDVVIADAALTHHPLADAGEPCLSFIVSDTPPRFTGTLGVLARARDWVRRKS